MKIFRVVLFCSVLLVGSHANAQNRTLRVGSLEIDNGDANVLTINYSGSGNATFSIPSGGGSIPPPGTVDGQMLKWNQAESAWKTVAPATVRTDIGAAASGANTDITSLASLTTSGELIVKAGSTVSLAASVNDQSTAGVSYIPVNTTAGGSISITGFANGVDGKILMVYHLLSGLGQLNFSNEDAGSAAANRIRSSGITVLNPGQVASFIYSGADSRWIMISIGNGL